MKSQQLSQEAIMSKRAGSTEFEAFWRNDGGVHEDAPGWARLRADMRKAFPTYYSTGPIDPLAIQVRAAIQKLDSLKQAIDGPAYLGDDPSGPHYRDVKKAALAPEMETVDQVVDQSVKLFQGLPNWNHPLTMPNVIPPANIAAIISAMMTEVFSPNIIEGEYAWDVEISELESAAILAKLIGWDAEKAGGLYTFGGSGCYFYGLKYALTRVLGEVSRHKGIRTDAKVLVSQQGHYCKQNSSDWTGLGMDNVIEIETDVDTNAMDLEHLESVMACLNRKGTPIASVVCTMGTTDAFAMDPVADVRRLIEKYPNPRNYGRTMLYCDAVIGWSWLTFSNYDFESNPLGFCQEVLPIICRNYEATKDIVYADAIGCDFHKVGWAPYNCSLFVMKDYCEFKKMMSRPGSDYLQERTCYNPGLYTLEVSRSGSYSMAGWATLKFFGHEGFQAVLGGILEMAQYLRDCIAQVPTMVCANEADHGFVTLFRVYPERTDAETQYQRELTEVEAKNDLMQHNKLQEKVADKLWEWFRDGKPRPGGYAPYISYTTGFRPTEYNREETDPDAMVYALKAFPMNVNINPSSMQSLIKMVLAARDEVLEECPISEMTAENVRPDAGIAVEDLLSGIGRRSVSRSKSKMGRRPKG